MSFANLVSCMQFLNRRRSLLVTRFNWHEFLPFPAVIHSVKMWMMERLTWRQDVRAGAIESLWTTVPRTSLFRYKLQYAWLLKLLTFWKFDNNEEPKSSQPQFGDCMKNVLTSPLLVTWPRMLPCNHGSSDFSCPERAAMGLLIFW